ncbi:MAG: Asp-tRNA(Asn)/Glu-tRNA(Gln) amidotransferase subunit GatA [Proteobacteria bacterium]|nr:Asp-tRNA(Asn)/Glu-tRNA(Gln) amidotransferase subunit GatA [Pseudomonadota bacterium]MBU4472308.1 Asp-tRNA(Asn)/Glu-tRNA(Gln) amidotransferase subunit GatA [Pseudomonadota bacterium]MCG2752004.1 Asp-tRNA(Asn)/Glu-tRNA(Gln) amidotransferase subunit GatA [Desulfobacteraceae bacterium]
MKLHELTLSKAHELLRTKEISSVELTRAVLDRIDGVEAKVEAFITLTPETALARAEEADQAISRGEITPLTGIPIAVKDLICTQGIRTTCASKILENFIPPYDATVITRLSKAGAVLVGKANMDEFAMGSSNENSGLKITRNPWNLECVPGGSSGGSAAAVAADMCLGALGSDTGGSIRQPASHCGIVGIKPTYGRVSRFGLVAFASSLDQIGPLAKTVEDAALLLEVISGHDPKDSTSAPVEVPRFSDPMKEDLKGCKIGLPKEFFNTQGLDPDVSESVHRAIRTLKDLGAEFVEVSLPHAEHAVAVYYILAPSEASSNLARYDGVKYGLRKEGPDGLADMYRKTRSGGFGQEVKRRIILGTYALSSGYYDAYYNKASQVRTLISRDYAEAFGQCHAILSPVAPTPAFRIGEKTEDPLTMYLSDIYTLSANLAGIPGMSVPCGFSTRGLPIGVQLLSGHFNEAVLLKIGYQFQQATNYHLQKPAL